MVSKTNNAPRSLASAEQNEAQTISEEISFLEAKLAIAKAKAHAARGWLKKVYSLKELFGTDSKLKIEGGLIQPQYSVPAIDNYVFRKSLVRDMTVFWRLGRRACMLSGEKGSGKTSIVEQWHNRLNINLRTITGNSKMTLEALFGQYIPSSDGTLIWVDGPITDAARNGYSVLINEFNALEPGLQLSLNDIAHDGSVFCVQDRGEQFIPAEGFRLYCTINPKGLNDHLYQGRKEIDASSKERFFWIAVEYGSEKEELEIVMSAWKEAAGNIDDITKELCKNIVDVGRETRVRSQQTGPTNIPEIISTRIMCQWANLWVNYSHIENGGAPHYALQRAFTNSLRPEVAKAIHDIVKEKTSIPTPSSSIIPD
jgi:MoxR-like ATPase